MMCLMSVALLVVVLSVQIQVEAGPIVIPVAVQVHRGDKDPGVQAKSVAKRADVTEATTSATTGEQESRAASRAPSKKCQIVCMDQFDPYCATNRKGQERQFSNHCKLKEWNCENSKDKYGHEKKGTCDSKWEIKERRALLMDVKKRREFPLFFHALYADTACN